MINVNINNASILENEAVTRAIEDTRTPVDSPHASPKVVRRNVSPHFESSRGSKDFLYQSLPH